LPCCATCHPPARTAHADGRYGGSAPEAAACTAQRLIVFFPLLLPDLLSFPSLKEKKQKKMLLGLIHSCLKESGLKSTAKKLKSELDDEVLDMSISHRHPSGHCFPRPRLFASGRRATRFSVCIKSVPQCCALVFSCSLLDRARGIFCSCAPESIKSDGCRR
jgi:hypothetical protein